MSTKKRNSEVAKFISENKIKHAINSIVDTQPEKVFHCTLLKRRLSRLESQSLTGVISNDDYRSVESKIASDVLKLEKLNVYKSFSLTIFLILVSIFSIVILIPSSRNATFRVAYLSGVVYADNSPCENCIIKLRYNGEYVLTRRSDSKGFFTGRISKLEYKVEKFTVFVESENCSSTSRVLSKNIDYDYNEQTDEVVFSIYADCTQ